MSISSDFLFVTGSTFMISCVQWLMYTIFFIALMLLVDWLAATILLTSNTAAYTICWFNNGIVEVWNYRHWLHRSSGENAPVLEAQSVQKFAPAANNIRSFRSHISLICSCIIITMNHMLCITVINESAVWFFVLQILVIFTSLYIMYFYCTHCCIRRCTQSYTWCCTWNVYMQYSLYWVLYIIFYIMLYTRGIVCDVVRMLHLMLGKVLHVNVAETSAGEQHSATWVATRCPRSLCYC